MNQVNVSFPVTSQDLYGYFSGKYTSNNQIICIMNINGNIDETILKKAVRLSIDAQPILGCHIIRVGKGAIWKQHKEIDNIEIFSIMKTEKVEEELQKFITSQFDVENDCQIKVKVFRNEVDTICVKINHGCSDGGGLKQYLNLLLEIYNCLFNKKRYIAKPSLTDGRGHDEILSCYNIGDMSTASKSIAPVSFPNTLGKNRKQTVVLGKLNSDQFINITKYARNKNATINDVLLTALFRSISKTATLQNNNISVNLTIDMRRYLPEHKIDAICNISSEEVITICHNQSDTFDSTLFKVMNVTQQMKRNNPGIINAFSLDRFGKLSWDGADAFFQRVQEKSLKNSFAVPYFSNMGTCFKEKVQFGLEKVTDCYMIGPALFAPSLLFMITTYSDILTVSVNFFQSSMRKIVVQQIIDIMIKDLCNC